jgi:hypothetical protein
MAFESPVVLSNMKEPTVYKTEVQNSPRGIVYFSDPSCFATKV